MTSSPPSLPSPPRSGRRQLPLARRLAPAFVVGVALASPRPALAQSKDAEAQQLADEAIFTDYLQLDFKSAERKLNRAIRLCKRKNACSPTVQAQVYRDLAVIYITGLKRQKDGKKLLVQALELDPRIALDADLTTPELVRIFGEAKQEVGEPDAEPAAAPPAAEKRASRPQRAEPEPEEEPPPPVQEEEPAPVRRGSPDCPPDFPGCEAVDEGEERDTDEADDGRIKNWVSVNLQQDFLMFGKETGVCTADAPDELSCFRANDEYRDPNTVGTPGTGGEVSGGFGLATTRILLGYERILTTNITLGARLGYAIGGGPEQPGGAGFVPFHAEARGNYWFGADPFASQELRSFVNVAAGIAQVDSAVSTQLIDQQLGTGNLQRSRVTVWKKTGTVFAALGFGGMYPLTERSGIVGELRAMLLLPSSGTSIALQAGYAFGF